MQKAGELAEMMRTLEHLPDGRRIPDEAHRHLQALRRDIAHAALHVVRDPLDEVPGACRARARLCKVFDRKTGGGGS